MSCKNRNGVMLVDIFLRFFRNFSKFGLNALLSVCESASTFPSHCLFRRHSLSQHCKGRLDWPWRRNLQTSNLIPKAPLVIAWPKFRKLYLHASPAIVKSHQFWWSSGNAFVSGEGYLRFKSRAGQIGHSVVNGSQMLQRFFERSCVARAQWHGDELRQLVTRLGRL